MCDVFVKLQQYKYDSLNGWATQVYALVTYRIWVIISSISKEAMYILLQMSVALPHTLCIAYAFYRTTKIHSNCLVSIRLFTAKPCNQLREKKTKTKRGCINAVSPVQRCKNCQQTGIFTLKLSIKKSCWKYTLMMKMMTMIQRKCIFDLTVQTVI